MQNRFMNAPTLFPRAASVSVLLALLVVLSLPAAGEPINVYLTYGQDTSRGIVVNYHLKQRLRDAGDPMVHFDTVSRSGDPSAYAMKAVGKKSEMPELPEYRTLNAVELSGLEPGTVYYFVAGDAQSGYTEERSFRTLPAGVETLRFVTGGDMGVSPRVPPLLAEAGRQDPMFCAIGGDIAYVNGQLWRYETWDQWFENYDTHLRTPEGRMVPMVVGIGNHESNDLPTADPSIKAPFYYYYFAGPQAGGRTYFARPFGANVAFIVLDSGHVAPHGGEQTAWLAETLNASRKVTHLFALYHVPLYPSHRGYEGDESAAGRIHWEPYFTAYHLTAAFENHDHKLKRAVRLSNGIPDENGVLYLGDGCFGVEPRPIPPGERRPYIEHYQAAGHFWVVDVTPEGVHYRAIGERGELLDEYRQAARPRADAVVPPAYSRQE